MTPDFWPFVPDQRSLCDRGHWTAGFPDVCPCGAEIAGTVNLPPLPAERWQRVFDRLDRWATAHPDVGAQAAIEAWMDRYIELRLTWPHESPALHERIARAEAAERKAA